MNLTVGILVLLLTTVIQSLWIENLHVFGGRPDLVMLIVITWTIIRGMRDGVVWGFIGGVFCDMLSGGPRGLWTLSLTTVALVAGQSWVYALGPTIIRLGLMTLIGTVLGHGVILALMNLLGYPIHLAYAYNTIVMPAALLNLILSPFAFQFLVLVHQQLRAREEPEL